MLNIDFENTPQVNTYLSKILNSFNMQGDEMITPTFFKLSQLLNADEFAEKFYSGSLEYGIMNKIQQGINCTKKTVKTFSIPAKMIENFEKFLTIENRFDNEINEAREFSMRRKGYLGDILKIYQDSKLTYEEFCEVYNRENNSNILTPTLLIGYLDTELLCMGDETILNSNNGGTIFKSEAYAKRFDSIVEDFFTYLYTPEEYVNKVEKDEVLERLCSSLSKSGLDIRFNIGTLNNFISIYSDINTEKLKSLKEQKEQNQAKAIQDYVDSDYTKDEFLNYRNISSGFFTGLINGLEEKDPILYKAASEKVLADEKNYIDYMNETTDCFCREIRGTFRKADVIKLYANRRYHKSENEDLLCELIQYARKNDRKDDANCITNFKKTIVLDWEKSYEKAIPKPTDVLIRNGVKITFGQEDLENILNFMNGYNIPKNKYTFERTLLKYRNEELIQSDNGNWHLKELYNEKISKEKTDTKLPKEITDALNENAKIKIQRDVAAPKKKLGMNLN